MEERATGAIVENAYSKITDDELKDLAQFWSEQGDAISLYFKPPAPSALAHREELILAKDQVKQALGQLRENVPAGKADGHADIQRLIEAVSEMKGNGGRTKVMFACARHKIWREYDEPGDFGVRLEVGRSFTLAPLIVQQKSRRRYCIALADRNRARLLLLEALQISEHSRVLDEDNEKVRTTGARKSGHLERKKELGARRHFEFLAEHLLHFYEHKDYECLIVGCRDEMWPEIEAVLHPEVRRILAGRFATDPGAATRGEVAEKAQAIVDARDRTDETRLVSHAVGAAAANGLGAVGLNAVIDALEKGEVRTLLWTRRPRHSVRRTASLCEKCGHLEADNLYPCALCGGPMRRFADAEEALLRHALGRGIEIREMRFAKIPGPDEIAALLRFKAEVRAPQAMAS